jgi:hypothetical protein
LVAARQGKSWTEILRRSLELGMLVAIPAVILTLPWALHNLLTYGDPFGWALLRQVTEPIVGPLTWSDYQNWLVDLYQSFWGRFGGAAHVRMSSLVYAGLGALSLAAVSGDLRLAWRWYQGEGSASARRLLPVLALHCLLVAVFLVIWAHTNQGTGQARLAYPALVVISIFFVAGLAAWVPGRHQRLLTGILGGTMLVFSLAILFGYLLPLYSPPPRLALANVPLSARKEPFDFGNQVRLLGWQAERTTLAPGEATHVTLYWQALTDLQEDYWLLLRLKGDRDEPAWYKDGSPSAGRDSTDLWRKGDVIAARHRLALAADTPPGRYRLLAGIHTFGKWEWLWIYSEDGKFLGDTIALEDFVIRGK